MLKIVSATSLALALAASAALAQNSDSKAPPAKSEQTRTEKNASAMGLWQSSKLIGVNVYNGSNEKIGDIKEIMLDKQGKADIVVISVGGFLGMGEHDVAIPFKDIRFTDQPRNSSAKTTDRVATNTNGQTARTDAGVARNDKDDYRGYPDHAVVNMTKDQLKALPQVRYAR
jgi:sporulation protein YlmC with PRC-barrel domain